VFDVDDEEVLTLATIRLANAITAKHQKYRDFSLITTNRGGGAKSFCS
jgi:hypothetical protein